MTDGLYGARHYRKEFGIVDCPVEQQQDWSDKGRQ
jgi:hypothetical protein